MDRCIIRKVEVILIKKFLDLDVNLVDSVYIGFVVYILLVL